MRTENPTGWQNTFQGTPNPVGDPAFAVLIMDVFSWRVRRQLSHFTAQPSLCCICMIVVLAGGRYTSAGVVAINHPEEEVPETCFIPCLGGDTGEFPIITSSH